MLGSLKGYREMYIWCNWMWSVCQPVSGCLSASEWVPVASEWVPVSQ